MLLGEALRMGRRPVGAAAIAPDVAEAYAALFRGGGDAVDAIEWELAQWRIRGGHGCPGGAR